MCVRASNMIFGVDTYRLAHFALSHLPRGTSSLFRGLQPVFRGLYFSPKLPRESNFDLESHLVLNSLATASVANKSLLGARRIYSNPDFV